MTVPYVKCVINRLWSNSTCMLGQTSLLRKLPRYGVHPSAVQAGMDSLAVLKGETDRPRLLLGLSGPKGLNINSKLGARRKILVLATVKPIGVIWLRTRTALPDSLCMLELYSRFEKAENAKKKLPGRGKESSINNLSKKHIFQKGMRNAKKVVMDQIIRVLKTLQAHRSSYSSTSRTSMYKQGRSQLIVRDNSLASSKT